MGFANSLFIFLNINSDTSEFKCLHCSRQNTETKLNMDMSAGGSCHDIWHHDALTFTVKLPDRLTSKTREAYLRDSHSDVVSTKYFISFITRNISQNIGRSGVSSQVAAPADQYFLNFTGFLRCFIKIPLLQEIQDSPLHRCIAVLKKIVMS